MEDRIVRPRSTDPNAPMVGSASDPTVITGFIDAKVWFKSMTIWGAIISMLMHVLKLLGLDVGAVNETGMFLMNAMPTIVGVVGDLVAIWGRKRATSVIVASPAQEGAIPATQVYRHSRTRRT